MMKKLYCPVTICLMILGSALLGQAQDCDCVLKDRYDDFVEYKGKYKTLRIPVECDSLFSMEQINAFLDFSDIFYESAQEFFGWEFLHPQSLVTTVNPNTGGAGTGVGGTGYGTGGFGIYLDGFDEEQYATEYAVNGTIIHEGIHRWDFRGQTYWQGPDIAHPFTVGLQDYMAFKLGNGLSGLDSRTTSAQNSDFETRRRLRYLWKRYLSQPDLNWEHYFSGDQSFPYIFEQAPKPEAYERLGIQGATMLTVIYMHGEEVVKDIFAALEDQRLQDPTWNTDDSKYKKLDRHIRAFGDGLQLDVSDYFDFWKYPVSDEVRAYLEKYPKSEKILDLDGDGYTPLQGDYHDDDPNIHPSAPELPDGIDNNLDGLVDETVLTEATGDLPEAANTRLTIPATIQASLASLRDVDAFSIMVPERSLVSVIFTSLNSDSICTYGNYSVTIFDGILRRNGEEFIRQDVASGENNIHRTEFWDPGVYELSIDGVGDRLCPGEYEIQVFINDQGPVQIEKNGITYKHHVYNSSEPNPDFDVENVNGVSSSEAAALKSIFLNNGGLEWMDNRSWLVSPDICYWRGARCDRAGLSTLRLPYERRITRPFTEEQIKGLPNLRELEVISADFGGEPLVDAFENWRNLSMLSIHASNVGGTLPESISDKRKLWFIDLALNNFQGNIPESWSNLSNLKSLYVQGNQLEGSLPRTFYQLENLREFYFDTDRICVPNQEVWEWLIQIPSTAQLDIQRCNERPTNLQMITPLDQSYDLRNAADDEILVDWTESIDPEGTSIMYTWVLAINTQIDGEDQLVNVLERTVSDHQLEISQSELATHLRDLGFGSTTKDFVHFTIASDGDWRTTTDSIAIELILDEVPCRLAVSIEVSRGECTRVASGRLELQANESFGPLDIQWSDGQTNDLLEDLMPGSYTVSVSDATGCSTVGQAFVPASNIEVNVQRTLTGANAKAEGGVAPYELVWSDGSKGQEIMLPEEKPFSLMVMDAQRCQQFYLSPPKILSPSGLEDQAFVAMWEEVPGASSYLLEVSTLEDFTALVPGYEAVEVPERNWYFIEGLQPDETYHYRVAAQSSEVRSVFSNAANVILKDEDCEIFVSGAVTQIVDQVTTAGSIEVTAHGGDGDHSFLWSDGGMESLRNDLSPGIYTVTVSDGTGCNASTQFEVQMIDGYSIGNLVWHDMNRNGIQDEGEPGIPDVKVVVSADRDNDQIAEVFIGAYTTDENGQFDAYHLPAGDYVAFVWEIDNFDPGGPLQGMINSPGSADPDNRFPLDDNGEPGGIGNPQPYLSVTSKMLSVGHDSQGSNLTVDFGFFNEDECPDMTARFEGDVILCEEDARGSISAIALQSIGRVRYAWSEENQTNVLQDVGVGTYEVSITDGVGCSQSALVNVTDVEDLELQYALQEPLPGQSDGSIRILTDLPQTAQLRWSTGGTGLVQENLPEGLYQVTLETEGGCVKVFEVSLSATTSSRDFEEAFGLRIEPNPTSDFIRLRALGGHFIPTRLRGRILDVVGREISTWEAVGLEVFNEHLERHSRALHSGIFVLDLYSDDERAIQKFVKKQ
ncbi:MAG: hypothetical protein KTR24_07170 [Saprospiraceae bacterium]|nr:hypothetical protein [Saprospiraceae bacterium]